MSKVTFGRHHGITMQHITSLSEKNPRVYLCLAIVLALIGHLYLFLFPLLTFEGVLALVDEIPKAKTSNHWVVIEIWAVVLAFSLMVSWQIFQVRFLRVQGLKLSKELTPELFKVIREVRSHYGRPSIKSVVLTNNYELRIEETPRFGYPLQFTNTLVIGLSLLQTLSPMHFRCELARLFGQYSGVLSKPEHWLYRTNRLWSMYSAALTSRHKFSELPLRWFFKYYAPLICLVAKPAIRLDELAADASALSLINDKDVFVALVNSTVSNTYLNTQYWPNVRKTALKKPNIKLDPFAKMEQIIKGPKAHVYKKKLLKIACTARQDVRHDMPCFQLRMENVGHTKVCDIPAISTTASEEYLGDARKNIVPIIDKLWRSTTLVKWKKQYEERCQDVRKIKGLSKKSHINYLGLREIYHYARLAKKLQGDRIWKSIVKLAKRNFKNLMPSFIIKKVKPEQQANDII